MPWEEFATGLTATMRFTEAGTHDVRAVVTDATGATATKDLSVVVTPPEGGGTGFLPTGFSRTKQDALLALVASAPSVTQWTAPNKRGKIFGTPGAPGFFAKWHDGTDMPVELATIGGQTWCVLRSMIRPKTYTNALIALAGARRVMILDCSWEAQSDSSLIICSATVNGVRQTPQDIVVANSTIIGNARKNLGVDVVAPYQRGVRVQPYREMGSDPNDYGFIGAANFTAGRGSGIVFSNVEIAHCADDALQVHADDVLVKDCYLHHCRPEATVHNHTDGYQSSSGINQIIEDTLIENIAMQGIILNNEENASRTNNPLSIFMQRLTVRNIGQAMNDGTAGRLGGWGILAGNSDNAAGVRAVIWDSTISGAETADLALGSGPLSLSKTRIEVRNTSYGSLRHGNISGEMPWGPTIDVWCGNTHTGAGTRTFTNHPSDPSPWTGQTRGCS